MAFAASFLAAASKSLTAVAREATTMSHDGTRLQSSSHAQRIGVAFDRPRVRACSAKAASIPGL